MYSSQVLIPKLKQSTPYPRHVTDVATSTCQGRASVLTKLVTESQDQSIMLDRAENLLHEFFGDADYWAARRSMKFR